MSLMNGISLYHTLRGFPKALAVFNPYGTDSCSARWEKAFGEVLC
jgi:hypothetical protein